MFSFSINWFAVGLSVLAQKMLGAAWFLAVIPKLYGIALGRTDLAGRKPGPLLIVGPTLCGLVVTMADAVLLKSLHVTAMGDALLFGTIIGVGYLSATVVTVAINPNIPRPLFYGAINSPYFVISCLVTCAILTAMV
jgi:Protein of unknown function (DUF1761)